MRCVKRGGFWQSGKLFRFPKTLAVHSGKKINRKRLSNGKEGNLYNSMQKKNKNKKILLFCDFCVKNY